MSRIDTIKSLLEQDPGNSRMRYMLAMETANSGDLPGAVKVYEELLNADPNYNAAYFHGGQALEKLGRIEEARVMYERGVDATSRNGDGHTRSELMGALASLG